MVSHSHMLRFLLAFTFVGIGAAPAFAATKKPANVIVILSDDVGYGEYGFQGNKDIPTPQHRLDRQERRPLHAGLRLRRRIAARRGPG